MRTHETPLKPEASQRGSLQYVEDLDSRKEGRGKRVTQKMMKAVLLHGYGDVNQLSYEDAPVPQPAPGELLVKTIAVSINPIDFKLRRGDMKARMPLEFPAILGRDLSGEVAALGDGVTGFKVGDRVFGLVNRSYAEYVVCKPEDLARIPDNLDPVEAAALPLVLLTGSQVIELGVRPRSGETVLVTGAVGGVGRTAVHVAKQHGARVIAGVRASQRREAEALSANSIVVLDNEKEIAGLPELDAVADMVGHQAIDRILPHIRKNGVLATVVGKPQSTQGRDLRVAEIWAQPNSARLAELGKDVAKGLFAIPIEKKLKLSQIREAQQLAEKGGIGKVVLTP
jgi:NADPH:quinone reductase-like Zn-dependent oxidoreductase